MAIVTRYFSTSSAGAGDGTTWADRAALFSGGSYSSVIIGFDFTGSDSLLCYIGPGTYTLTAAFTYALWSGATYPNATNHLTFAACDSSGNPWSPPDPGWKSCEPAYSTSGMPLFDVGSNYFYVTYLDLYGINFTSSRTSYALITYGIVAWCQFTLTGAGGYLQIASNFDSCVVTHTGSSYTYSLVLTNIPCRNTRIIGNPAASSGSGVFSSTYLTISEFTIVDHPGDGIDLQGASSSRYAFITGCVIADNGGDGISLANSVATASVSDISHNVITGNGAYGLNLNSQMNAIIHNNRLRDNASGVSTGLGMSVELNNYTTDSDDATEYVDAAGGDYTIKSGCAIHGQGYGVADEAAGGGSPSGIFDGGIFT